MTNKIETSLSVEKTKELRQLLIDNPDLPLVIFAGEDSWRDEYPYEFTYAHGIRIDELAEYRGYYLTKEDYEEELIDDLSYLEEYKKLSDDDFKKMINEKVAEAEFTRCIVFYVG